MATPNRTALVSKLHKVLKKHYSPVLPDAQRPLLEQLVFACCLENAPYDAADAAFAALQEQFFDWNEVRVSTITELSESISMLPNPAASATNLRRILQHVFETTYSFDQEELRKQNLGPAVERLQKLNGSTPFVVAYVTQTGLGGHAIPVDRGALAVLEILQIISPEDREAGVAPGLERAVAKNKGVEFGSLLHQLGTEMSANPHSPNLHKLLLEVDPGAKERLPKRSSKKAAAKEETAAPDTEITTASKSKSPKKPAAKKSASSPKKSAPAARSKKSAASLSKRKPR